MPERDNEDVWVYFLHRYNKVIFSAAVFEAVETIDKKESQDFVLEFASRTIMAIEKGLHYQDPHTADTVAPALNFCKCLCALLSPVPFYMGSSPENVDYCLTMAGGNRNNNQDEVAGVRRGCCDPQRDEAQRSMERLAR